MGQLTAWSLELTPQGPFVSSPNVPVTLNPAGTVSSTLALNAIPATEVITSGAITLAVEPDFNNPVLAIADLTITLTGPGGQTFTIPTAGNFNTSLSETIQLPAAFIAGLLSGTYTLSITDGTAGDVGKLVSWSIALSPAAFNGNAMDQNSDGVTGEDPETTPFNGLTPGDDYAVPTPQPLPSAPVTFSGSALPPGPYTNSTLPLIVPGPHITQTNVTGTGGATTGTSTNNTVANDQVNSVGCGLRPERPDQLGEQLAGSQHPRAGGPDRLAPDVHLLGRVQDLQRPSTQTGTIPRGAGTSLDSTLTISNTGLTLSSLTVNLNITDPLDSSLTLTLIAPNGTKKLVPLAVNVGGPTGRQLLGHDLQRRSAAQRPDDPDHVGAGDGPVRAHLPACLAARRSGRAGDRRQLATGDPGQPAGELRARPRFPAFVVALDHAADPPGTEHLPDLLADRLEPRRLVHDRPPGPPAQHHRRPTI